MESTVYGHPGEPKPGPGVPPALLDFARGAFGLTFENQGLRARVSLERDVDKTSHKNEDSAIIVKQSAKLEAALRQFLRDNKASIEKDAPFVYESDTLAGGATVLDSGDLIIGKWWTVKCLNSHAHAEIKKTFGKKSFVSEVIEVELEAKGDSVNVISWKAYTTEGRYIEK